MKNTNIMLFSDKLGKFVNYLFYSTSFFGGNRQNTRANYAYLHVSHFEFKFKSF